MQNETVINECNVYVSDFVSYAHFVALALDNLDFQIEHECEVDYGNTILCTLTEGIFAEIREISEHQIGDPSRHLFAHAYVKVESQFDDPKFYEVEVHEDPSWCEDEAA